MWRNKFIKGADLMFTIPPVLNIWPHNFHKHLLFAMMLSLRSQDKCKLTWVVCIIRLVVTWQTHLEVGLKVSVGGRPLEVPFMVG